MSAAAEVIVDDAEPECHHCGDRRVVWNAKLGKAIRCPQCTTRRPKQDSSSLHALNAAEARRVERASQMIRAAVAVALRDKRNPAWIADANLRVIDRIMQRWAVGHGSMVPPDDEAALPARPPPLDPVTQTVIDDIVNDALPNVQKFIGKWYRSQIPCKVMAAQLGMTVDGLYQRWEVVLGWLRGMFLSSKHSDLIRMCAAAGA